jgi:hypothetical protein
MNTPSLAKGTSTTLRPLRRHRWVSPTLNFLRHYAEMVAAMVLIPSFAVIALFWSGAVEETGSLLAIQHTAMPLSMLVVMLVRRTEYSQPASHA